MTGRQLKILLIHRFFKPDSPPYAFILDDIRQLLETKGMVVDVLSSQPSYKSVDRKSKLPWLVKSSGQGKIFRLPVFHLRSQKLSKLFNFVWFPFVAFWFVLLGKKYDVVTVSTAPPVVLAFFIALACRLRGFNLIYHCMDIHPEIGRISGEFRSNAIFKMLLWMDNITCRIASRIIVLSEDMETSMLKRNDGLAPKISIINNYDLESEEVADQDLLSVNDGKSKKRVIFAGNIGRFQNLDSFVWALKNNQPLDNFELVFMGEGTALENLKNLAKGLEDQVRFIPHQSLSVAKRMIEEADAAIVSLQEDVIKYAFPSKTMTYLAVGTPILAMVEKDSELAKFIVENGLGHVVNPGDSCDIYKFLKLISEGRDCFNRKEIINTFSQKFSRFEFNKKFFRLLDEIY